ncbi:HD domain-containing protein [Candidatus Uabimicrobium amorphum]|uniref:5'-deoxynucleotidase n=1 Tax=Uabimicrobium amorphum TaxID=2596890 RepID=A0A5S9IU13_UABAM|nr:HD domain-containing protein [Candidatus Uabimicrobium amorphum]BBM87561.1 phosphohydrolase [Candidatus Uabimicrobium amorphum]
MHTKGVAPIQFLRGKNADAIVAFYFEFAQLKQLYRQGWLQRSVAKQNCESVAEHTFSVTLLAMIVADAYFPEFDTAKIMRMCLIHDLAEAYTGDYTPQHNIDKQQKKYQEQQAITKMLSKLPNSQSYIELWQEYHERQTKEAQFVKYMDQLDMVMQASIYEYLYDKDLSEFMSEIHKIDCPQIQNIFEKLCRIRHKPDQRELL